MSLVASVPQGEERRVRIGRRWYDGAWAYDEETGESFFGVKLNGVDWVRVAEDVIEEVAAAKPRKATLARPAAPQRSAPAVADIPQAISRAPLVEMADVAARVTAMVRTLRFMPDSEARFLTAGSRVNWPATVYTAEDMRAQAENHDNRDSAARRPRHRPTPADLAQLDAAWAWFCQLDPLSEKERKYLLRGVREGKRTRDERDGSVLLSATQKLVWRRALGDSFQKISKDTTGEHHETIRRRYDRAIERLAAIAEAEAAGKLAAARSAAGSPRQRGNARPQKAAGGGA